MMKEKLNVSASNIVNVCIDNIDGVERSGRFYCYYSKDPIFFRSIHELFRYMERFMNELNFPQSSTELRTYEDKQQKPANEKRISFTEVSNREQILEQRGSIDTLAVYVRYRQNATWQGSVYHMKNNEREDFNSELDLLKIIENCQNSTNSKTKVKGKSSESTGKYIKAFGKIKGQRKSKLYVKQLTIIFLLSSCI